MSYAIVYSSRTGNTERLARAIREAKGEETCLYFGTADERALIADVIYVGFWTDKGTCDGDTCAFLKTLSAQKVFLFGTAGFGGSQEYFDKILAKTKKHLPKQASVIGTFMCQGKMPASVRERYEKLKKSPIPVPNIQEMIDNFDKALSHPNVQDLEALKQCVCRK